ncbi:MAG TPA: hypothetical protein IAB01_08050 [Candidatus Avidesulfovibrio excrementigallinarum]|nr:hypothetical protein [Candidatus Avidesulfovibrio excrementigallinarum]
MGIVSTHNSTCLQPRPQKERKSLLPAVLRQPDIAMAYKKPFSRAAFAWAMPADERAHRINTLFSGRSQKMPHLLCKGVCRKKQRCPRAVPSASHNDGNAKKQHTRPGISARTGIRVAISNKDFKRIPRAAHRAPLMTGEMPVRCPARIFSFLSYWYCTRFISNDKKSVSFLFFCKKVVDSLTGTA